MKFAERPYFSTSAAKAAAKTKLIRSAKALRHSRVASTTEPCSLSTVIPSEVEGPALILERDIPRHHISAIARWCRG